MTDFIDRGLKALAFYWLSIHGIGLMMYSNGQTSRDNWLWGILSSVFKFEAWGLGVFAAGAIIYLVYDICTFIFAESEELEKTTQLDAQLPIEPYSKQGIEPTTLQAMPVPTATVEAPKPKPPPPPTPEELKRKALRQITGKEF